MYIYVCLFKCRKAEVVCMYARKSVITTTIPADIYMEIKKKGIPFNHILQRGWQVFNGEPQLLGEQRDLREQVKKLQEANARLQKIVLDFTSEARE